MGGESHMTLEDEKQIDPGAFWRAIGARATGVTIVTAAGEDGPAGFLALSATHLTASPPIVTVAIDMRTSALEAIRQSAAFAINYLSTDSRDVFERFTAKDGPRGAARFEAMATGLLSTGAPIFETAVGALDCRLEETIERFGTVIALGRVVNFISHADRKPMIHFQGKLLP